MVKLLLVEHFLTKDALYRLSYKSESTDSETARHLFKAVDNYT